MADGRLDQQWSQVGWVLARMASICGAILPDAVRKFKPQDWNPRYEPPRVKASDVEVPEEIRKAFWKSLAKKGLNL